MSTQKETKHTPGPWRQSDGAGIVATWDTGEDVQLCLMSTTMWSMDKQGRNRRIRAESEANARLIASAPEIYEALKAANQTLSSLIEKAERGESADIREFLDAARMDVFAARAALTKAEEG